MAGSYQHATDDDGSFRGLDLIDNLGDAYETIEEMHLMIAYMAARLTPGDPRRAIHEAWLEGYLRPLENGNVDIESIAGFEAYWDKD